jgi:flagellar motor switch/type III secretory pathway protein FliN
LSAIPFDLGACPRVPRWQARAARAVLRTCALLPDRWPIEVPPLGSATVSFAGIVADTDGGDQVELPVSFGLTRGRVGIEPMFAVRLVDRVLGGRGVFSTARAIGPAEAGVLAGVLAPAFDRIGGGLHLGALPIRGGRPRDMASISFRLDTAVGPGWLRLTVPAGGLPPRPDGDEIWRARAPRVPVIGHIEIATTAVPASAFVAVAAGDAVVFEGVAAAEFAPGARWNARLRVGGHAADLAVEHEGKLRKLTMAGGFSPLITEEREMGASGSNTDATTVLGAASIEVVAELGRVALRGDELLGLAPGAVLALGAERTGIALRVGGEVWAEGEIVDIDGELGVRVTRLANR